MAAPTRTRRASNRRRVPVRSPRKTVRTCASANGPPGVVGNHGGRPRFTLRTTWLLHGRSDPLRPRTYPAHGEAAISGRQSAMHLPAALRGSQAVALRSSSPVALRHFSPAGTFPGVRTGAWKQLPLRTLGSCRDAGDQTSLQLIVTRSVNRGRPRPSAHPGGPSPQCGFDGLRGYRTGTPPSVTGPPGTWIGGAATCAEVDSPMRGFERFARGSGSGPRTWHAGSLRGCRPLGPRVYTLRGREFTPARRGRGRVSAVEKPAGAPQVGCPGSPLPAHLGDRGRSSRSIHGRIPPVSRDFARLIPHRPHPYYHYWKISFSSTTNNTTRSPFSKCRGARRRTI